jgi:hypothetical protein
VKAPTFGAEGASGGAPVTRAQGGRGGERWPGTSLPGPAAARSKHPRRPDAPGPGTLLRHRRCRRSWTRGHCRRVKWAPVGAETRAAACKGVSAVRRHAGGLYDAGTYCYTHVKCLKRIVGNGKGVIEANDYTQGPPINSEPIVMKRTHCNEKRAPKAFASSSVFGLRSVSLFPVQSY